VCVSSPSFLDFYIYFLTQLTVYPQCLYGMEFTGFFSDPLTSIPQLTCRNEKKKLNIFFEQKKKLNKWGQEVRTGSGLKVYGLESPITAQRPLSARVATECGHIAEMAGKQDSYGLHQSIGCTNCRRNCWPWLGWA
jgi:hypothetical protein